MKSKKLRLDTRLKEGDWLITPKKPNQTFVVLNIVDEEIRLGSMFFNVTATIDELIADRFEYK